MGLYSRIRAGYECAHCGWSGDVEVQFKYGNLYEHDYEVGDGIVWGRTQVGDPSEQRVVVEGISACPQCDVDAFFDVSIEFGDIKEVKPASGLYDYHHGEGNYVVL